MASNLNGNDVGFPFSYSLTGEEKISRNNYRVTHLFKTCKPADMNIIQGLFECLKGSVDDLILGTPSHGQPSSLKKATIITQSLPRRLPPAAATKAFSTLQGAENAGCNFQAAIEIS